MAKKVQVVLDDETYGLLKELASPRAGNKSFVVREALRYYADREGIERALDAILAKRHVRESMESGLSAWQHGHLVSHEQVARAVRQKKRR
ncbi:MAG: hypothetical protein ACRDF1_06600 [bacterium]